MTANAWDQLNGESPQAFRAFAVYRDQGSGRSLEATTAQLTGRQPGAGRASGRVGVWSARHRWQDRVRQFDKHLDAERLRAAADLARANGEMWAQRAEDLREKTWVITERLMEAVGVLVQFPVVQQSRSADGLTTTWEASDPKALRTAAALLQVAWDMGLAAIQGVPAVAEAPAYEVIDPAAIEQARADVIAWHKEKDAEVRAWQEKQRSWGGAGPPRSVTADGARAGVGAL